MFAQLMALILYATHSTLPTFKKCELFNKKAENEMLLER